MLLKFLQTTSVVKASASGAADPGFNFRSSRGDFSGLSHTSELEIATPLQWLPCQAPGVIGSALGSAGPVSVYCDWVEMESLMTG